MAVLGSYRIFKIAAARAVLAAFDFETMAGNPGGRRVHVPRAKSMRQQSHSRFRVLGAIVLTCGLATLSGCRNDAGTFAAIGTGLGAATGAIIGHQSGHGGEGALIGAGAGALGGYILGNESDKHRHDEYYHGGRRNYDY